MLLDLSDSLKSAKELLGYKLINETADGVTSGYIVETEAYSMIDTASHSFKGMTSRTKPMFDVPGTIYVYFTYGIHYCFNIVTGPIDNGQAVLIRALQPIDGLDLMRQRRDIEDDLKLTNGPAKLVQAMAIDKSYNGKNILDGSSGLRLESGIKPQAVVQTTRIGIKKATDLEWRFYIKNNQFVSRK